MLFHSLTCIALYLAVGKWKNPKNILILVHNLRFGFKLQYMIWKWSHSIWCFFVLLEPPFSTWHLHKVSSSLIHVVIISVKSNTQYIYNILNIAYTNVCNIQSLVKNAVVRISLTQVDGVTASKKRMVRHFVMSKIHCPLPARICRTVHQT